jgi:hypothetical protein
MMKRKPNKQFEEFEATLIYCPNCKEALPVRKRLLLSLLNGEKYDYICKRCATHVGTKLVTNQEEGKIIIAK